MININTRNNAMSLDICPEYNVIHPLFDKPEKKLDPANVGPMKMTKAVKYSLMTLRLYLIFMIVLAFYRTFAVAGII